MKKATKAQMEKYTEKIKDEVSTMQFVASCNDYVLSKKIERIESRYNTMLDSLWSLVRFDLISYEQRETLRTLLFDGYFEAIYPLETMQRQEQTA